MEGNTPKAREIILPERLEQLAEQYAEEARVKEQEADGLREQELRLRAEVFGLRTAVEGIKDARSHWERITKENAEQVSTLASHQPTDAAPPPTGDYQRIRMY